MLSLCIKSNEKSLSYCQSMRGALGSTKKPKNRSKNYPKPKNRDRSITTENRIQNHHNRRFIQFNFQNPSLDVKR